MEIITEEFKKNVVEPALSLLDTLKFGEKIPSIWQVPKGYKLEKLNVEGVQVEHLIPLEKKTDKVIYHLHGGGYVVALLDMYRDIAVEYSKIAGGAEIFSIDYRVAPTDKFPCALNDAVTVYK